jgi:hypothetical protein
VPRRGAGLALLLALVASLALAACSNGAGTPRAATPAPESGLPLARTGRVVAEPGVRIADGAVPTVWRLPDGRTWLYYCNLRAQVTPLAISEDGLRFAIQPAAYGRGCDGNMVWTGAFLRLYYHFPTPGRPDLHTIYSATSLDGVAWYYEGVRLSMPGEPCSGWTSVVDAVSLPDGRVRLYFTCGRNASSIASAISSDGLAFTFENVLVRNAADPDVVRVEGGYRLFYTYWEPQGSTPFIPSAIREAFSTDGLDWRVEGTVVTAADFGMSSLADPSVMPLPDGSFRVYLGAGALAPGEVIVSALWRPASR